MKTLHIISHGSYSDYTVDYVAESLEVAEQWLDGLPPEGWGDDFEISTIELVEPEDLKQPKFTICESTFYNDREPSARNEDEVKCWRSLFNPNHFKSSAFISSYDRRGWVILYTFGLDAERVRKVHSERFARTQVLIDQLGFTDLMVSQVDGGVLGADLIGAAE